MTTTTTITLPLTPTLDLRCDYQDDLVDRHDLKGELQSLGDSAERDAMHYDGDCDREYYTGD